MRNGLPEIQYLTLAKEGEEGVGAAAAAAAVERRRGRGILADNKKYKRKKNTQIYASEIQTCGCQGEYGTTAEELNRNYRNVFLHNFSFRSSGQQVFPTALRDPPWDPEHLRWYIILQVGYRYSVGQRLDLQDMV